MPTTPSPDRRTHIYFINILFRNQVYIFPTGCQGHVYRYGSGICNLIDSTSRSFITFHSVYDKAFRRLLDNDHGLCLYTLGQIQTKLAFLISEVRAEYYSEFIIFVTDYSESVIVTSGADFTECLLWSNTQISSNSAK